MLINEIFTVFSLSLFHIFCGGPLNKYFEKGHLYEQSDNLLAIIRNKLVKNSLITNRHSRVILKTENTFC